MIQKHVINSEALKRHRLAAGLTQADLARALKTKENYYGKIERDEVVPSLTLVKKITEILKVKTSDILVF